MIKIKFLGAVSVCLCVITANPANALIPTIDIPNIGESISMVAKGVTEIKQFYDSIQNGSILNAVIGDSAGTLSQLRAKYGKDLEKAMKDAEAAKKRVTEGVEQYKKYKEEIEGRKKEYQALIDSISGDKSSSTSSSGGSEEDYDDIEPEADSDEDFEEEIDSDFDEEAISTLQTAKQALANGEMADPSEIEVEAPTFEENPSQPSVAPEPEPKQETQIETPKITPRNDRTFRRRYVITDEVVDETPLENTEEVIEQDTEKVEERPLTVEEEDAAKAAEEEEELLPRPNSRRFRQPARTTAPVDRLSSTISSSTPMMFALFGGSAGGSNYDDNGTFISPLPKRCGLSINDLQDSEKVTECLKKIVQDNYNENSFTAEGNRRDCTRMVYETVFAIAAEAAKTRNEAAGYNETIEKMRDQANEATTVRDDMAVIAANSEQTLVKLNQMSLLLSARTILDTIDQVCNAPKEILDEDSDNNGGN